LCFLCGFFNLKELILPYYKVNSLTAIGPYMAHIFLRASFEIHKLANLCPLTTLDS
jgi:hypothetical protein